MVLTPEEWVRQHFIHFLITIQNYPRSLIRVESGLTYNTLKKRTDIVVYDRSGRPWMLVECKSPDQKLTNETLRQAGLYNAALKASFLAVTNGMDQACFSVDWVTRKVEPIESLPDFPQ